jgi:hypothetical protein
MLFFYQHFCSDSAEGAFAVRYRSGKMRVARNHLVSASTTISAAEQLGRRRPAISEVVGLGFGYAISLHIAAPLVSPNGHIKIRR